MCLLQVFSPHLWPIFSFSWCTFHSLLTSVYIPDNSYLLSSFLLLSLAISNLGWHLSIRSNINSFYYWNFYLVPFEICIPCSLKNFFSKIFIYLFNHRNNSCFTVSDAFKIWFTKLVILFSMSHYDAFFLQESGFLCL